MLKEYFEKIKNGTIGFVGCGVSNRPILEMAVECGLEVTLRDKKPLTELQSELDRMGVKCIYGEKYLEDITESVLFLSPAVRPDLPELIKARENGCYVTTEMEEFLKYCPCRTIGVTGSDGKTTTTTLISEILKTSGKNVHLGGNIGKNLFCRLDEISADDIAVMELSSFQLMKMDISPDIAVVTNVAPNHLDWHTNMEEYVEAKFALCKYQDETGILILNADDEYAKRFAANAKGRVIYTSIKTKLKDGVYFDGENINKDGKPFISDADIRIVGLHNRANYCEAIAATLGIASEEAVKQVAKNFGGVEHRCEFVREKDGVKYYNSSIDSSPSRTTACLNSFKQKVICICGGYDKKIPYEPLAEVCLQKAKQVILIGATSEKIARAFDAAGFNSYTRAETFEGAVKMAESMAVSGDIIVLSPASASFDMFKNFAERGNIFKQIVNNL